ncbi:MAG: hypothetical protein JSV12_09115 [Candidatus Bathyarchaeota archaeon]|nr:MAG: hypothetical protein JSV12_09115 [Candidatus Bathyarchaeota archaeon]
MRLIRNVMGISNIILILLLLVAAIFGATLSYMWTMGGYISLGLQLPEAPFITITNVTFYPPKPVFFNVTLLNPSLSPSGALVTNIKVFTEDGDLHEITQTFPVLNELSIGESQNIACSWDWKDYTGENAWFCAFIANGSGAAFQQKIPLVDLTITEAVFDSAISITNFNLTIQNSASSVTDVNITEILVNLELAQNVIPSLPYTLQPNTSVKFSNYLNWTKHQGKEVEIKVDTSQGYVVYHTQTVPQPVDLAITNVLSNTTDTTRFNVTVQNNASSPTHVDVTGVTVTVNETTYETELNITLPHVLQPNSTVTLECSWDWTIHQGMTVMIAVYTKQGFKIPYVYTFPAS